MQENLEYKISLKDLFSSGLNSADKSAHRFQQTIDETVKKTGNFGNFFADIGKKLVGAFAIYEVASKSIEFAKESFHLAEQQADAEAKLLTAVNQRKDVQEYLIEQAGKTQMKYGVDDADLMAQQTSLISSGRSVSEITKMIGVAMGYARAKGGEWQDHLQQLNFTYGGLVKSLGKANPELKLLTKEQLANGEAVDLLEKKYQRFIDMPATGIEKIKIAGEAWSEFKESVGNSISGMLEDSGMLDTITTKIEILTRLLSGKPSEGGILSYLKYGLQALSITGNTEQSIINDEEKGRWTERALNSKDGFKEFDKIKKEQDDYLNSQYHKYETIYFTGNDEDNKNLMFYKTQSLNFYNSRIRILTDAIKEYNRKKKSIGYKGGGGGKGEGEGEEALSLSSGLSEPKASKIQNITINMNNVLTGMKNTYASMEMGADDFIGKLGQALNKVVLDASILATE